MRLQKVVVPHLRLKRLSVRLSAVWNDFMGQTRKISMENKEILVYRDSSLFHPHLWVRGYHDI